MTGGIDDVRSAIANRETLPEIDSEAEKIGIGAAHSGEGAAVPFDDDPGAGPDHGGDGGDGGGGDDVETGLPAGFPVQPLGMSGGKFHFLTARGELIELSAGALSHRSNLVALMAGVKEPAKRLADIGKPDGKRDTEFNAAKAGDALMQACGALPIFDKNMQIRHVGTWRGASGYPVVHLGEELQVSPSEKRRGRMISKALYPAVTSIDGPAKEPISVQEVEFLAKRINSMWNWQCADAGELVIAFVGQAVLGQYPDWRSHLWINGKHGSGKTTLLKIISNLLGGMSSGVKNGVSAASIRQMTNRMAVVRIIDEGEKEENSNNIEDVIKMFRLLSGAEGARVEKGTSDHAGIRFELFGAGVLGSIIPGGMAPQDRSRFVMLTLGDRKASANPGDDALRLDDLESDALALGPLVWRRMLKLAPKRWTAAARTYNGLIQSMGGRSRDGDTIGAMLAGWDLMLFDEPLLDPETGQARPERLERARKLAQPLLQEMKEADEMGEGERLLNTIFGGILHKEHGGVKTVSEEIQLLNTLPTEPGKADGALLARIGLRVFGKSVDRRQLFVANPENPLLNKVLAGTRWRGGGHKAALQTIPEVTPHPGPMRVDGRPMRGLVVPARFLPGYEESPENGSEASQ